ncbi:hypothetical protein RRG08_018042 [Elysia crispata]|uniref:Uncharacterized protein n=1 Tax=Elysia crispata TaxID=231223 RepID=A0AAE0ZE88_9GAST|nr:hypothetical protein RRG08_018042 [Elysia crispata]
MRGGNEGRKRLSLEKQNNSDTKEKKIREVGIWTPLAHSMTSLRGGIEQRLRKSLSDSACWPPAESLLL